MSDNIPFDIQTEIIKRLPVKSVVQCRSVSKLWKSLIDSSKFIKSYHTCKTHSQHNLFLSYHTCKTHSQHHRFLNYWSSDEKYVSVVDDDTFPNQQSSITVPHAVRLLCGRIYTQNSVNGLLCFYGACKDDVDVDVVKYKKEKIAVLWNPSVGKAVGINFFSRDFVSIIGFGVCPNTSDPKLVKIDIIGFPVRNWEVEVFMFTTRVWKSVSNIPPAFKTCGLKQNDVCIDGSIYWLGFDSNKYADVIRSNLIILFDLKSDEFGEVCLPDRLAHTHQTVLSKVYESLGLFEYYNEGKTQFCDIWIMKDGVTKSFTKMLSIKPPDSWVDYRVLELRKNGEAIIENIHGRTFWSELEVYDTSSGSISGMGINGYSYSFLVNSYTQTLLLLDESNSIIH